MLCMPPGVAAQIASESAILPLHQNPALTLQTFHRHLQKLTDSIRKNCTIGLLKGRLKIAKWCIPFLNHPSADIRQSATEQITTYAKTFDEVIDRGEKAKIALFFAQLIDHPIQELASKARTIVINYGVAFHEETDAIIADYSLDKSTQPAAKLLIYRQYGSSISYSPNSTKKLFELAQKGTPFVNEIANELLLKHFKNHPLQINWVNGRKSERIFDNEQTLAQAMEVSVDGLLERYAKKELNLSTGWQQIGPKLAGLKQQLQDPATPKAQKFAFSQAICMLETEQMALVNTANNYLKRFMGTRCHSRHAETIAQRLANKVCIRLGHTALYDVKSAEEKQLEVERVRANIIHGSPTFSGPPQRRPKDDHSVRQAHGKKSHDQREKVDRHREKGQAHGEKRHGRGRHRRQPSGVPTAWAASSKVSPASSPYAVPSIQQRPNSAWSKTKPLSAWANTHATDSGRASRNGKVLTKTGTARYDVDNEARNTDLRKQSSFLRTPNTV